MLGAQEVAFGENVRVHADLRLCERDSSLNRKLLRATLAQAGLARLTIADMLPQDLDADLARSLHPNLPYLPAFVTVANALEACSPGAHQPVGAFLIGMTCMAV